MKTEKHVNAALEVVPKLAALLTPLAPEDRSKAISATMILLGQSGGVPVTGTNIDGNENNRAAQGGIPAKATDWMRRYGITKEQLDHVFSIESDGIDVIASKMPGNSKRKQTLEAYVLCGLSTFLRTGELTFTQTDARNLCQKVGCYDRPNHSNYTKGFGNFLHGSKDGGWKLTNPGLGEAARIIKQLVPEEKT